MLQLRLRVIVMVFFTLCLLLWVVRIRSCASWMFAWLGIMPMQVWLLHTALDQL